MSTDNQLCEPAKARDPTQCAEWKTRMMREVARQGLITEASPLAFFWNLSDYQRQIQEAKDAFPSHFLHTVASKANPLVRIMEASRDFGAGAEAASLGELQLALKAHPDRSRIMLDSPAKTRPEIRIAINERVGLTIDNLDELSRVDDILGEYETLPTDLGLIGIRINPQIGGGAILTHSVSKLWSKFGTPIHEKKEEIIAAYETRPWMNMVHVHAGSQTYSLKQLASAIRVAMDLVLEINAKIGSQQIKTIDIGGGLPVNFEDETSNTTFAEWSAILKETIPELFSGEYNVITEYGRRFLAKQGMMVSRIEYVKEAGGRRIILQHAGADVAVRTVYRPEAWPLRVTCFGANGAEMLPGDAPKSHTRTTKPLLPADVAGPCCIDDVLNPSQRPLPDVEEGDYIMMHDTGAYYHSAYSFYNCRQAPALYCFTEPASWEEPIQFETIRKAATVEETIEFFYTQ